MTLLLCTWLALAPPSRAANALQVQHSLIQGDSETTLVVSWTLPGGREDSVTAALATAEMDADKAVKRQVHLPDLYRVMAQAATESAARWPQVALTVRPRSGGVELGVRGPPDGARAAMTGAQEAMDQARAGWLRDHQVFEIAPGQLSYDHAAIAAARAPAVAPLAAALRAGTDSDRAFVARALAFAQSFPYQRARRNTDAGLQRPLALLARNKGDCDGKSTLFLSLVRAELPHVPLAFVYVPDHALVGVGLPAQAGDQAFEYGGAVFIYAEPVGPGAIPLGEAAPASLGAAGGAMVRIVP